MKIWKKEPTSDNGTYCTIKNSNRNNTTGKGGMRERAIIIFRAKVKSIKKEEIYNKILLIQMDYIILAMVLLE